MSSYSKHLDLTKKLNNQKWKLHLSEKWKPSSSFHYNNTENNHRRTSYKGKDSSSIPLLSWGNKSTREKANFLKKYISKECPGGTNCKNYTAICALEKEIQKILHSNEQYEKINIIYKSNLSQREKWYIQWLEENKVLKKKLEKSDNSYNEAFTSSNSKTERINPTSLNDKILGQKRKEETSLSRFQIYNTKTKINPIKINTKYYTDAVQQQLRNDEKIVSFNFDSYRDGTNIMNSVSKDRSTNKTSTEILTLSENNKFQSESIQPKSIHSSRIFRRAERSNTTRNRPAINPLHTIESSKSKNTYLMTLNSNQTAFAHYDAINSFNNKSQKFKYKVNASVSFLSNNKDYHTIIKDNTYISQWNEITMTDEMFIHSMQNARSETLITYSDAIISLIKDYKEMVRLNLRMKEFIEGSVDLVDSVLNQNSSGVLINNTCKILNCERASLFIYDKITDTLVVHTGEGMKKGQIKIPKDQGIVGAVFMEGKKLKIDDVYLDKRFNKAIDKLTNFRTRSILCYPLQDKEGNCFGCIEAINKREKPFDCDDEELLNYFSQQASAIWMNMINSDEHLTQISRLKTLLDFSVGILEIKDKHVFTFKCEEMLMNIFTSIQAKLIFIEDNSSLKYYGSDRKWETYKNDLGIIAMVLKNKEIYACQSLKKCPYFNWITDWNSNEGLLTFPIKKDDVLCAIAQVPYSGKVSKYNKPKQSEINITSWISRSLVEWFTFQSYN